MVIIEHPAQYLQLLLATIYYQRRSCVLASTVIVILTLTDRIIVLNTVNSILESHSLMPCDYNAKMLTVC